MFTGIVHSTGRIIQREAVEGDLRLRIEAPGLALAEGGIVVGGSIAVDGCCLTATAIADDHFEADVSRETLALTSLGQASDAPVNLEPALAAGDALGGHLVTGHVDGLAELVALVQDARSTRMRWRVPGPLARYIARKGSVCLAGVSLTVNAVEDAEFEINLVPHTLEVTNLGRLQPGDRVNLEVDIFARYLERLLRVGDDGIERDPDASGLDREALIRAGFIEG